MTSSPAADVWVVQGREIDLSKRSLVMGILNITPDSFSDGGRFSTPDQAVEAGLQMAAEGVDIIDVGGESTRPGRPETVTAEEELKRVLPVIEGLRVRLPQSVMISIDTYKEEVARRSLTAGASIVNDVYGLVRSPDIARAVAEAGAGLILMHMQGEPQTMQQNPRYGNLLVEIRNFLRERLEAAQKLGVPETSMAVDPGIGFGKTLEHNLEILSGLEYLRLLQRPICIGASRKKFLGHLVAGPGLDAAPLEEREEATVAAQCAAVLHGATIVRTHNVLAARRSLAVIDAIRTRQ